MKIYYNPKLMPYDDLVRLLFCKIPDNNKIYTAKELLPYLNDRWVELLKKSELSFEKLEQEVYYWLQMENPFLDSSRPQDLAAIILASPHYNVVLSRLDDILENDYKIFDMETIKNIYEAETFGSLLQLLHVYF